MKFSMPDFEYIYNAYVPRTMHDIFLLVSVTACMLNKYVVFMHSLINLLCRILSLRNAQSKKKTSHTAKKS